MSIIINILTIGLLSLVWPVLLLFVLFLLGLRVYSDHYFRSEDFYRIRDDVKTFPEPTVEKVPWVIRRFNTKRMWQEFSKGDDQEGDI